MAKLAFSKLSVKSQTVLPLEVRERLGLKPGDTVSYRLDGDAVVIERAQPVERDDPFATFAEWTSREDDEAYADL